MSDCENWVAWMNRMPGAGSVLHVTGNCSFGKSGCTVELRRYEASLPGTQGPSIVAPATRTRSADPPQFQVDPSPHAFYAVEVATRSQLFDRAHHEVERTAENFFASWAVTDLLETSTYTLPADVWHQLQDASLLYYRAITSERREEWVNSIATTPDDAYVNAPFIFLPDAGVSVSTNPKNLVIVRLVHEPQETTNAIQTSVSAHYHETTDIPYETVTILPEGIIIPVQEVF